MIKRIISILVLICFFSQNIGWVDGYRQIRSDVLCSNLAAGSIFENNRLLTDNTNADSIWDLLSELKTHRYFKRTVSDVKNEEIEMIEALLYEAMEYLHRLGLVANFRFRLNLTEEDNIKIFPADKKNGIQTMNIEIGIPACIKKVPISYLDKQQLSFRMNFADLAVRIFAEITAESIDLAQDGLTPKEQRILKDAVALDYVAELCVADAFSQQNVVHYLETKGVSLTGANEFSDLINLTRGANYYWARLGEVIYFVLRQYRLPEVTDTGISRERLKEKFKELLDRKEEPYYLDSFTRSGSARLRKENKREKIAVDIDRLFRESMSEIRHVPVIDRAKKAGIVLLLEAWEKIEGFKELRHPKVLIKKMWDWAIDQGGIYFAIFIVCYSLFEDGEPVRIPWIDFKRGKKAGERTAMPNSAGAIVVIGFGDEVKMLEKALSERQEIISFEGPYLTESGVDSLADKLNTMVENNAMMEKNALLRQLKVMSFSEIADRCANLEDLKQVLIVRGLNPSMLRLAANGDSIYLIGKNFVTVFTYDRQAKENLLIVRSGESIGDICLDPVTHPRFISLRLTDKVRIVMEGTIESGTSGVEVDLHRMGPLSAV